MKMLQKIIQLKHRQNTHTRLDDGFSEYVFKLPNYQPVIIRRKMVLISEEECKELVPIYFKSVHFVQNVRYMTKESEKRRKKGDHIFLDTNK